MRPLPLALSLLVLPLAAACGTEDEGGSNAVVSAGGSAGTGTAGSGTAGSGTAGDPGTGGTATAGSSTAGTGGTTAAGSAGSGTAGTGTAGSSTAGTAGSSTAGAAGTKAGAAGTGTAGSGTAGSGTGGGSGTATLDAIKTLAGGSSCAKYDWKDRGLAPKGYIKGVALTYARAVCEPTRSDVVVVSQANTGKDLTDALSWFNSNFQALGMSNDTAGIDTLRHAYTLLIGLGMRESSGEHCVGRDTSATNTTADSAEAGAWQTSYDSHGISPELPKLFSAYQADGSGCLLDVFKEGVSCSAADWENWGTGDGMLFQKLEKECPSFAGEYAAVMLRVSGGSKGHYGPLRTKAAEIRPECDAMLKSVQDLVTQNPAVCGVL